MGHVGCFSTGLLGLSLAESAWGNLGLVLVKLRLVRLEKYNDSKTSYAS